MIDEKDLLIESCHSWIGKQTGMQPVDVPTGVKIIHIPTGIAVFVNTQRSQFKNKTLAIKMIELALADS
jgi:protein subunit release factor A